MRTRSLVLIVAVVASSCSTGASPLTTTAAPAATTTTLTIPARVETTTTIDPGAADEETTVRLSVAVDELVGQVEVLRGLVFVAKPHVLVLRSDAFRSRLDAHYEAFMSTAAPVGKTALYQAAGFLRFDTVESILARLPTPATPVFYDEEAKQIVVSEDAAGFTPPDRAAIVHELILALTDQHHDTASTRDDLVASGADDRLRAFDALREGDATYFQLVFIQNLPEDEQVAVAEAFAATDSAVVAGIPDFIRSDLAFPYDAGTTFVGELVASAGIAAVDQAYRDLPASTEHILHPERYRRGEAVVTLRALDIALDGATVNPSATFGELQLDHLLSLSLQSGAVTQAVDGWQGDQYQLIETAEGVAFALTLAMLSDDDAIEVVSGLIAHAREVLQAGDGVEAAGGLLWDDGSRYVFLDRVGDGLMYVLATDRDLGRAVRAQVQAP